MNLEKTINLLDPYCDGYHLDIMDGHFVPNLTWGPQFVATIAKITPRPLFLHMMVDDPELWLPRLEIRPHDIVCFHIESTVDALMLVKKIKAAGWKASIALNPETPARALHTILDRLDDVLVMTVEPGFSGQPFMASMLAKITELAQERTTNRLAFTLSADGGITKETIMQVLKAGANQVAVASALFGNGDPLVNLMELKNIVGK